MDDYEAGIVNSPRPLTPDRLPDFVAIYALKVDQNAILEKLGPLIDKGKPLSPLFGRFAIEQTEEAVGPISTPFMSKSKLRQLRAPDLNLRPSSGLRLLDPGPNSLIRAKYSLIR